jgi:hypothetical protein
MRISRFHPVEEDGRVIASARPAVALLRYYCVHRIAIAIAMHS